MSTMGHAQPTARKTHICGYCGQEIPVGQVYRRWACVGDGGGMDTVKAHIACDDLAANYYADRAEWPVDCHPFAEWPLWQERPADALAHLGAAKGWQPGEEERLAELMRLTHTAEETP